MGLNSKTIQGIAVIASLLFSNHLLAQSCSLNTTDWGNGFVVYADVSNTESSPMDNWQVELEFNQQVGVYGNWGSKLTKSNNYIKVDSASYNAELAPGESANFGLVGDFSKSFQAPQCNTPYDLVIQEMEQGFCYADAIGADNSSGEVSADLVNNDNALKNKIVWKVNARYPGSYQLKFHYANGSSSALPGTVFINDKAAGLVALANTSDWDQWSEDSISVELEAGDNEIILVAQDSSGLANIDQLSIHGLGLAAVSCAPSEPDPAPDDGVYLPQENNPVQNRYERSKTAWSPDLADIVLSYQFDNGGWPKNQDYVEPGSGGSGDGEATIDNGATSTEIVYLAQVYQTTGNKKYLKSVRKAMEYLLEAQYPSGGWPQFYPLKKGYYEHATYNDNAMTMVLTVLHNAQQEKAPFDKGVFNDGDRARMKQAVNMGVDYILKSQWIQNGTLTAWCAQHGAYDYLPKPARAYELESISGLESAEIIGFLMTQPQTPEIKASIDAALAWFRSPDTILQDYVYDKTTEEKIVFQEGGQMWYRFYDLDSNQGFFSDRDGGKYFDLMEISAERRNGYSWGGNYGKIILPYAESVGY